MIRAIRYSAFAVVLATVARGADFPRGEVIAEVSCAADPSQSYVLYLPSNYVETRPWSVVFLFDPGARGRRGVERFQAAAEKYGYILAGSNNSRNGPWEQSIQAALAMMNDAGRRFAIDAQRIYTAGLSGGSRVAMKLAMDTGKIAGVIASSAGFPDFQPRKTVAFDLFGTAGSEDFNYLEMRELDRIVTSPHRVAIFQGGHTWLPSELAIDALEWMELQAMKSGRRPRDDAFVEVAFNARVKQAEAQKDGYHSWLAWSSIASDFRGLKEVAVPAALQNRKDVKDAIKRERSEELKEARDRDELMQLIEGPRGEDSTARQLRLAQLKPRLSSLSKQAKAAEDSPARRMARRQLANASAAVRSFKDPDVQKLFEPFRPPNPFQ